MVSAALMIGVIRPVGVATATEMSAFSYWRIASSVQAALAAGTFFSASAVARMTKSLTDSLYSSDRPFSSARVFRSWSIWRSMVR